MTDLKELARELAEATQKPLPLTGWLASDMENFEKALKHERELRVQATESLFIPILAKHFPPAEPKPAVSLDAVVERIATKMAGRGSDHEHIKEIIRAELAEVAEVLKECESFVRMRHTHAKVRLDETYVGSEHEKFWLHEMGAAEECLARITKLTGVTNGEG